ncbi:hypothetical protein ACFWBS_54950 [Streptomyces mirabilis]|uniref:hypothetical protein n=1 Tax=Streptomyces mirabilis TaxID=68239 RepID=UPI00366658FA
MGEALTELQLLTDDPRVLELADTLVDATFTLHEAPDRDRRGHLALACDLSVS